MAIEVRDGVEVKWCSRSKHYVPVTGFGPNRAKKSGLQDWCNDCIRDLNYCCALCGRRRGDCRDFGGPLETEFGRHKSYCKSCMVGYNKNYLSGGRLQSSANAAGTRRRARVRGAEGEHTTEETALLKWLYGETCPACNFRPVEHIDHVEPLAGAERNDWEGTDWVDNLQWLCVPCNLAKSDRNDNDFRPDGGAAARAVQRLELYKVRNSRDRKHYVLWIKRILAGRDTLADKTAGLLAIKVRDAYEVGKMVKDMAALQYHDEAVYGR